MAAPEQDACFQRGFRGIGIAILSFSPSSEGEEVEMRKAIRPGLRFGILALGLAFAAAPCARAQVGSGKAAAKDTPASNNQKTSSGASNVVVLDVLPWDLPGVGGGFVAPQATQSCDSQDRRRAAVLSSDPIVPLRGGGHDRHWSSRTGWTTGCGFNSQFR
jgi:hypothetical protein